MFELDSEEYGRSVRDRESRVEYYGERNGKVRDNDSLVVGKGKRRYLDYSVSYKDCALKNILCWI